MYVLFQLFQMEHVLGHKTIKLYLLINLHEMKTSITDKFSSPPLLMEDMFQDPQWIPETWEYQTLYMVIYFLYIHTYDTV
jgi:hypothetical protein